MAKQVEDIVTDDRVETLKTVKFGGYDKASVDYYIDELKEKHNKEVEELKANVNKLSEAVLSLKTMREVNMTEYECKVMREEAQKDAANTRNTATEDATRLRNNVKKECASVSRYMSDLLSSLDNVISACSSTKDVADRAFTGLKSEATEMVGDTEEPQQ